MADRIISLELLVQADQAGTLEELDAVYEDLIIKRAELARLDELETENGIKLQKAISGVIQKRREFNDTVEDTGKAFTNVEGSRKVFEKGTRSLTRNILTLVGANTKLGRRISFLQRIFSGFKPGETFKQAAVGAKTFTVSLKAVKTAIIATGIGLLAVAIALIVANFDKIKALVSGISVEQKRLTELSIENANAEKEKLEFIEGQENILRLQGKSEKEILQIKQQQTDETIIALEAQLIAQKELKKQQVEGAKRNRTILKGVLDFVTLPFVILFGLLDELGEKILGKEFGLSKVFDIIPNLIFDPEKVEENADATIKETENALNELRNRRAGFQLSIQKIDQKAADDRDKLRDKELKAEEERLAAIEDILLTREEREIRAIEDRFNALIEAENTTNAEIIALAIKREEEIDAVLDARADKRRAVIDAENERKRKQDEKDRLAAEKLAEEQLKIEQEKQDAINDIQASALGVGADLVQAVNEDILGNSQAFFAATKGIRIAEATMLAIQAANNALANTPAPPPFPQIAAATALAIGLLNVRKIAQTRIGRSVPSSGGVGPTIITPVEPRITDLTVQTPERRLRVDPIRVVLVESDITDALIRSDTRVSVSEVE